MKKINLTAILLLSGVGMSFGQVKITGTTGPATTATETPVAFTNNISIGENSLPANTTSTRNIAIGNNTLQSINTTVAQEGTRNTAIGNTSISSNITGTNNTAVGDSTLSMGNRGVNNCAFGVGSLNATGNNTNTTDNLSSHNSAFGVQTLLNNNEGRNNCALGYQAMRAATTGNFNTAIGNQAGSAVSNGSNNIFIGNLSGFGAGDVSNQLFIESTSTTTPLIHGDFDADELRFNGQVGIGAGIGAFPQQLAAPNAVSANDFNYNLFVTGGILTEEVRIRNQSTWADYVFQDNYELKSLTEVETYINENGHLPNVPSAEQVEAEGIAVSEMMTIQQEKIEELTLYIIQLSKEVEALKAANKKQ